MSIQDLYDATFDLYSYEITSRDSIGGVVRSLVLKQASILGYITPLNGDEEYKYGKTNVIADFRLFCDPIEIETTDIIKVVDEFGTNYYNILYIDDCDDIPDTMPEKKHYEIDLLRIKAPEELTV